MTLHAGKVFPGTRICGCCRRYGQEAWGICKDLFGLGWKAGRRKVCIVYIEVRALIRRKNFAS